MNCSNCTRMVGQLSAGAENEANATFTPVGEKRRAAVSFAIFSAAVGCATLTSAADALIIKGTDMGRSVPGTPDPNGVILTHDTAQGELTHIGRYTMNAQEFINLNNLVITGGAFTITAANGDTLTGVYSGTGKLSNTPTVITYDVAGPITGGTGRFRNATGLILFLGTADLATNTFTDQVSGVIVGSEHDDAINPR